MQSHDAGFATVEIAVALPALLLVTVAALWGVALGDAQMSIVDAARTGARAAARGEPLSAVRTVVARASPDGSTVEVRRTKEITEVAVTVRVRAPVSTGLPPVVLRAKATATTEPGVVTEPQAMTGPYHKPWRRLRGASSVMPLPLKPKGGLA
nr:TadE family type IV pilus minor pilin [Thermomonospora umbrina]